MHTHGRRKNTSINQKQLGHLGTVHQQEHTSPNGKKNEYISFSLWEVGKAEVLDIHEYRHKRSTHLWGQSWRDPGVFGFLEERRWCKWPANMLLTHQLWSKPPWSLYEWGKGSVTAPLIVTTWQPPVTGRSLIFRASFVQVLDERAPWTSVFHDGFKTLFFHQEESRWLS